jgi:hypothetical protein
MPRKLALAVGGTGANLASTGGTNQVVQQAAAGAAFTVGQLDYPNLLGASPATEYNGNALVSAGLPSEIATVDVSARTTNQSGTLFTPTANTMFRVNVYTAIDTVATTSSTLPSVSVTFTDPDSSVSQTVQVTPTNSGNATTTLQQGVAVIYAKSGVAITYANAGYASSGATAMTFGLHIKLEQL